MIKKILSGIALATALAFNTNAQESKIVDFHPEILAVAKEGKPITRGSLDVEFNKYDSDLFLFGQHEGDSDFYKARIQYRSLELGNVSIGGTIQTSGVRDLFHSEEAGLALRMVGSPLNQSFGLAELRYFPKNERNI